MLELQFITGKTCEGIFRWIPYLAGKKVRHFAPFYNIGDKRTIGIIRRKLEAKGSPSWIVSLAGLSSINAGFGPRIFNKRRPNKDDLKKAENFGKMLARRN